MVPTSHVPHPTSPKFTIFEINLQTMTCPVCDIIIERTSRRTFESRDLPAEVLEKIRNILESSVHGPLGSELSFILVNKFSDSNQKLKLGTYGFITGARYFIVGKAVPEMKSCLDFGYMLEKAILELTAMGLGTCWLGGTFDRAGFARSAGLEDGQVIPAISPVGYATQRKSIGERIVRLSAGSKNRKPWQSLIFDQRAGEVLYPNKIDPVIATALEMVRLAPSASNNQPWRIIYKDKAYHFYLERKPGYRNMFGAVDIQMLDMGIAMCHFGLTTAEQGITTEWVFQDSLEPVNGWEYVITAVC